MSNEKTEEKRTRPFADFLNEHTKGLHHTKASETLQELVGAVVDTGKKGTMTITVTVEPMKGNADALLTTINVAAKLPAQPVKAAVFYADGEHNLTRNDPNQPTFDGLKDVGGSSELRDAPEAPGLRQAGGDR